MKKVITIIGIFGLIFVQAQVGINQDAPKATLDIESTTANTTTDVEGLLVPRVHKEKAYKMATATTKPQESNLVYVNNANYAFPVGATDAQKATVADITEKGYYFWNGAKWVSISTVEGSIWKYANDKVFVDRSTVTDNVEYLKEGGYRHFPRNMRQVTSTDPTTGALVDIPLDINSASIYNWNLSFSDLIKTKSLSTLWPYKTLGQNSLYVDENEVSSIENYYANVNEIRTTKNTRKNLNALYGVINNSFHYGQGNVTRMIGTYSSVSVFSPNVSVNYMHGGFNQGIINSAVTVKEFSGTKNHVSIRANGAVTSFIGTDNNLVVYPNVSPTITNTIMTNNRLYIDPTSGGHMDSFYGVLTGVNLPDASTLKIKNMYGSHIREMTKGQNKNYGILIENVGNTTATENYAIYTKAGKVHLGDDVSIGTTAAPKKLNVSGVMRLEPQATAPTTGALGDLYVGTNGKIYFYNGTAWKEVQLAP